mmetsp:Transcript_127590/g.369368  ORF Transcript_127590/g.369368 Transcript_127590/m.369368 type:complete len:315 (+) Transcript_127590:1092-2036(+)
MGRQLREGVPDMVGVVGHNDIGGAAGPGCALQRLHANTRRIGHLLPLSERQHLRVAGGGEERFRITLLLVLLLLLHVLGDEGVGHIHLRLAVDMQPRDVARRDNAAVVLWRDGEQVAHPSRPRVGPQGAISVRRIIPDNALRLEVLLLPGVRDGKNDGATSEDKHPVVGVHHLLPQVVHAAHALADPQHLADHLERGRRCVVAVVPQRRAPIVHLQGVREVQNPTSVLLAAVQEHRKALHSKNAHQRIVVQHHVPIQLVDEAREVVVLEEIQKQSALRLRSLLLHPSAKHIHWRLVWAWNENIDELVVQRVIID